MARKGKEPAGLRRYRLAQKRKKKTRRVRAAPKRRKIMARRRRKGRRKSSKPSVPIGQTAVFAIPVLQSYTQYGMSTLTLSSSMRKITGYNPVDGTMNYNTGIKTAVVLLAMSTIGRKVANKTGANRLVKKMSMGYLSLF